MVHLYFSFVLFSLWIYFEKGSTCQTDMAMIGSDPSSLPSCVLSSPSINQQSLQSPPPPGDIHPFIQWALTEGCLKEAPTMTWMMMFPPKFLLKLGSQCHQITFRKRRCQRGFIPHRVCRRQQLAKVLSSCPMRTQRSSFWEVVIARHRFESMEQPGWTAVLVISWLGGFQPSRIYILLVVIYLVSVIRLQKCHMD